MLKSLKPLFFLLLLWSEAALASSQPPSMLELEKKALDIYAQLRCPVCGGQSLAESDADLAKDLRKFIYQQVKERKNQEEIIAYMVDRYGASVHLKPSLTIKTFILWASPFVLFFMLLFFVIRRLKVRD
jgi:cytochrome c-type biogenesis protein CcmH